MGKQVLKKRYQIQKPLGKNGGRRTLLARDLQTQELVAIKLLVCGADFQWDDLKLFEREAQTLQSLSHPAIPRYLDYFKFQTSKTKGFALVQSYIKAKSLEEWVKLGRTFNQAEIKQIAKALLEILMYLHTQHPPVIHRDIQPSNILLVNRSGNSVGQVYLVNFGSVQTLAATEGSTIRIVRTYGYMPPEQFDGQVVPTSDLYSLGATLIYLVTGMHPADLPQQDWRIQLKSKNYLDSAFVDWLKWMTEPDLNNRLTSAKQSFKLLKQLLLIEEIYSVTKNIGVSKIRINNYRDKLEFIFSDFSGLEKMLRYLCMGLLFIFIIVNFSVLKAGVFMIINVFNWLFYGKFFMSLLNGLIGIFIVSFSFLIIGGIIKLFPKSTRLRIDPYKISLNHLPPSPRRAIWKLEFSQYSDTDSCIRHNIQIRAGRQVYKLPTEALTEREVNWIVSEISNLLELIITKYGNDVKVMVSPKHLKFGGKLWISIGTYFFLGSLFLFMIATVIIFISAKTFDKTFGNFIELIFFLLKAVFC
ncbi:MAG: serine/threonine-protein kinase [Coleofasciculus sp. B1-GNL1-01]|uniref:serine/threonine protein kinase n=1 Tax=Coleofasciculus sp. B1-GNL1-01 TaxID=3068484 RepID=UPI0032FCF8ED